MNTSQAFKMGQRYIGRERMVFDWDKAAQLIREHKATDAAAGLRGDWGYTGGTILRDGQPAKDYTYLASTWAVPELLIDGEYIPCYKMESETPGWDESTKWPCSALAILRA